jgi:hypothetical protein
VAVNVSSIANCADMGNDRVTWAPIAAMNGALRCGMAEHGGVFSVLPGRLRRQQKGHGCRIKGK